MAKTRSQEDDPVPQWFSRFLETNNQRISQLETMFAEWCASRNQTNQMSDDQSTIDRNSTPSRKPRGSGSEHYELSSDGWLSNSIGCELETGETDNDEDRAVENEANTKMISAMVKEESMPQFQVPVSASKILKNVELEDENSVLKNLGNVVLNENLEPEWDQKNVKEKTDVDGDVARDQILISDTNTGCAHKVLVKMPSKEKRMKHLNAWKFKFKSTSKRSRLMDDKFSFVDATVLLNKEPQETIWDCVKKEFKETMAACGKNRVDRFKLAEEKESKLQVLDLHQTFLCNHIGCGIDILLVVKMLDHDKGMAVVLQRSTSLTTRDCPDRSSRANRVWKPGLEIYGCVTKKQMLLNDKLANHVWHRWKNKAGKLKDFLVCSGKRWSFVVYAFYDHTVVLRKEPILSPKIKRGFELSYLPNLEVKVSLKGEDLI